MSRRRSFTHNVRDLLLDYAAEGKLITSRQLWNLLISWGYICPSAGRFAHDCNICRTIATDDTSFWWYSLLQV